MPTLSTLHGYSPISNSSAHSYALYQITFFVFYSLIAYFTYILAFCPMLTLILTLYNLLSIVNLHFPINFNLMVVFLYCIPFSLYLSPQIQPLVCYVYTEITLYLPYFPIKNITGKLPCYIMSDSISFKVVSKFISLIISLTILRSPVN